MIEDRFGEVVYKPNPFSPKISSSLLAKAMLYHSIAIL